MRLTLVKNKTAAIILLLIYSRQDYNSGIFRVSKTPLLYKLR